MCRFTFIDAANCILAGPFNIVLDGGAVARLHVESFFPASAEDVMDLWAVNAPGNPISLNRLTADSLIADVALPSIFQVAAEVSRIVNGIYTAPRVLRGHFFQGEGMEHRLILFRPGTELTLGMVRSTANNVDFYSPSGTVVRSRERTATCIGSQRTLEVQQH